MADVAGDVCMYTVFEGGESSKSSYDDPLVGKDRCAAAVEYELLDEATLLEKYIIAVLKHVGSSSSARIHHLLKLVVTPDRPYTKSLKQLESFLNNLVLQEKLEARNGMSIMKE